MTGIWMAVYTLGNEIEGYAMVGRLFMSPNVWPGIQATGRALRSLKRTLSGEEPPTPAELNRRFYEKRKKMLEGRRSERPAGRGPGAQRGLSRSASSGPPRPAAR